MASNPGGEDLIQTAPDAPERKKPTLIRVKALLFFVLLFSVQMTAAISPAEEAEQERLSGELSVAAMSRYIDRGQELSRNSVVLQPSFTLCYKGFSANIWGSWDSNPYLEGEDHWYETDYTLSYEGEYGFLTYGLGYMYYDMDNCDDSQEIYLMLGLNTLLAPTLTVYREVDRGLYWYFVLSLSHAFPLSEKLSLELCASAAYLSSDDAEEYPEVDGSGSETGREYENFHDGTVTVGLPYTAADNITITPTLSYTFPLCRDARHEMKYFSMTGKDDTFVYGGVVFAYRF